MAFEKYSENLSTLHAHECFPLSSECVRHSHSETRGLTHSPGAIAVYKNYLFGDCAWFSIQSAKEL